MVKLEAVLEQRGIASPREMSEAIARCELHGGDLTTSLLQFVTADEAQLSAALSECYGLPAAVVGLLPAPKDDASKSLPREVAERYCCFPLETGPGILVVAVAAPLDAALKEELSFALGVQIEERVALEVRIRQAISRHYGLPLSPRNQRGIARLDGDLEQVPVETPLGLWPDTQLSSLPRPPSERPPATTSSLSERPFLLSNPPTALSSTPPSSGKRPSRRRGPFSLELAREELARATTRNDVLDVFFSFTCQFFEYSSLFAVHNAIAEGLDAWGPGADHEAVIGIGVPLDLPSSLSEAAESCKVRLTRLGREGIDRKLASDLKRPIGARVLILPICLRGRCAVLLYADNGTNDVVEREIGDVIALAPDVASALGRIILLRKREAQARQSLDPTELSASLAPPARAPSDTAGPSRPPKGNVELAAPEATDVAPSSASKKRDKSRSNGRSGSKPDAAPPPAVATELASPEHEALPKPEIATALEVSAEPLLDAAAQPEPAAPSATLAAEATPPAEAAAPAAQAFERQLEAWAEPPSSEEADAADRTASNESDGATANDGDDGDGATANDSDGATAPILLDRPLGGDPVFLLARTVSKSRPSPASQARAPLRMVAKPPTSITHPARVSGSRPRLPSVIVDTSPGEVATRAAMTQPPQNRGESGVSPQRPPNAPRAIAPAPTTIVQATGRARLPSDSPARPTLPSTGMAPTRPAPVRSMTDLAQGPSLPTITVARTPVGPGLIPHLSTGSAGADGTTVPAGRRPAAQTTSDIQPRASEPDAPRLAEPTTSGIRPTEVNTAPPATSAAGSPTPGATAPAKKPSATATSPGMPAPIQLPPAPARPSQRPAGTIPKPQLGAARRNSRPPAASTSAARPAIAPPPAASLMPQLAASVAPSPSPSLAPTTSSPTTSGPTPDAPAAVPDPSALVTSEPAAPAPSIATAPAPSIGTATAPSADPRPSSPSGVAPRVALSNAPSEPFARSPSVPPPRSMKDSAPDSAPASSQPLSWRIPPSRPSGEAASLSQPPPSIIDLEKLVDQLCQGNAKAAQDLTRIGAPGVPQLMARFPGPVISERAGPNSRASECGPLLQALASIGSPATADVTRSSEDQDARVRRWATLLLGELPGAESCRAVVQRLADEAPRVHQAALDAARLLLGSSAANLFRKTLFDVAEAEDTALTLRLRTLEHVAKLKDSASVPRLIGFLTGDLEPIVHKALWALSVVTRQDFGRDAGRWWTWWHAHQAQHRLEWLIEALDHKDVRLRKAAAEELELETHETFGYSEQLGEPERQAVQQRYRDWWSSVGAQRFGRHV